MVDTLINSCMNTNCESDTERFLLNLANIQTPSIEYRTNKNIIISELGYIYL